STRIYTLSLHDALPISAPTSIIDADRSGAWRAMRFRESSKCGLYQLTPSAAFEVNTDSQCASALFMTQFILQICRIDSHKRDRRSEEHTSELQSLAYLV